MFEKTKKDWADMPETHRWAFGGLVVFGLTAIALHAAFKPKTADDIAATAANQPGQAQLPSADTAEFHGRTALPDSNRNQGLEDLSQDIRKTNARVDEILTAIRSAPGARQGQGQGQGTGTGTGTMQSGPSGATAAAGSTNTSSVNLDELIAAPTFTSDSNGAAMKQPGAGGVFAPPSAASAVERAPARMKVWEDDAQSGEADVAAPKRQSNPTDTVSIPVNSALESVLLSGFNARPTGSTAGAVGGAQTSANNVGAPFVTRIKGDAILPNGWRLSDLGDCFLGGSAVAVLSAERAYAVADQLSCIKANGEIWEGHVKAYALDVDGTLGIAGKVVSKQGSLLMQAALTGVVSGLGNALSPTAIPTYSSNGTNGSTAGYQLPNLGAVGATAAGQGVSQASSQLSKFYLQYASEVFPVVEVVSTTRATWVLEETVTLKRRIDTKETTR